VYEKVREDVLFLDKDRLLSPDINHMQQLVLSGQLNTFMNELCPSLS
jgi:histidine ammonia-lyase